jgi:WbqC-like protein family
MKIAIIQPYLFPYIGYFQLMKAVDTFVVFDDVQFIRRGWINRNRLLNAGNDYLFTLNVLKAPQETLINEMRWADSHLADKKKLLEQIQHFYGKAPFFKETYAILLEILSNPAQSMSPFIVNSLSLVANYLGIKTPIVLASDLTHDKTLKGQERIIDLAKFYRADHYINPIGGMELYQQSDFKTAGLELSFVRSKPTVYKQFSNEFLPFLSIIDVMMFNSKEQIDVLLSDFDLIKQ